VVRKYFLRIWKGGAVKATVRAKVITILGAVMYVGQCARSGGIRGWTPTAAFTLASSLLSPLTV
jgi:hypothetical protein